MSAGELSWAAREAGTNCSQRGALSGRGNRRIEVNAKTRPPTLRDDLKELRNRFFHYGHDQPGDDALRQAMTAVATNRSSYVIGTSTLRARYADLVATLIAHPFDERFAPDMHGRIVDLIGPIATYVQMVEAAWLYTRPDGMVTYRGPGDTAHRPFSELK